MTFTSEFLLSHLYPASDFEVLLLLPCSCPSSKNPIATANILLHLVRKSAHTLLVTLLRRFPPFYNQKSGSAYLLFDHLKTSYCAPTAVLWCNGSTFTWVALVINKQRNLLLEFVRKSFTIVQQVQPFLDELKATITILPNMKFCSNTWRKICWSTSFVRKEWRLAGRFRMNFSISNLIFSPWGNLQTKKHWWLAERAKRKRSINEHSKKLSVCAKIVSRTAR